MDFIHWRNKMKNKDDKTIIAKIDNYLNEEQQQNLNKAVETFVAHAQKMTDEYFKRDLKNLTPDKFTIKKGGRYIKIIQNTAGGSGVSVWAFIDAKEGPTFGDIYKPASWNAPAKGTRGNVFSQQNGIEAIGGHGSRPHIFYAR